MLTRFPHLTDLLSSSYVVYDTQLIVERCEEFHQENYVAHAADLFIDFVAIFVRILIILAKNAGKKEKEVNERRCAFFV